MTGLLLLVLACAGDRAPAAPPQAASSAEDPAVGATGPLGPTIPLRVGDTSLQVEVADDDAERSKGLMHRDGLATDHGMLFVYRDLQERGFWMRNTRIPLSIAFADDQGRIVHIADMAPFDQTTTRSQRPAMYAIEMDQGWFSQHGVMVGSKVDGLPGPSRE